jgi:hypothetical protein
MLHKELPYFDRKNKAHNNIYLVTGFPQTMREILRGHQDFQKHMLIHPHHAVTE